MDRDTGLILLAVLAVVLLARKRAPVPSVSTSSTVALPDGSTVALDPLTTVDRSAMKNALDLLLWK